MLNFLKSGLVAACAFMSFSGGASALTIDTNALANSSYIYGWDGIGQSLTVDAVESHLDDISFDFNADSVGQTFTFTLTDAVTGGNILYSTNFSVAAGINTFLTDIDLAPSSVIYALFNFNGFTGQTNEYLTDAYNGGILVLRFGNDWFQFHDYELAFTANFSAPTASPVPLPAALPLLLAGLGGFALLGRRKRA